MTKFVRVRLNEVVKEREGEIMVADNHYELVPQAGARKVYDGDTLPMPLPMIMYLRGNEIKVFAYILNEIRRTGHCLASAEEIAKCVGLITMSVVVVIERLKKMGFVYSKRKQQCNDKYIDFKMVSKVQQLTDAYGFGYLHYIRNEIGLNPPINITENMRIHIRRSIEKERLLAEMDPIEREEYV